MMILSISVLLFVGALIMLSVDDAFAGTAVGTSYSAAMNQTQTNTNTGMSLGTLSPILIAATGLLSLLGIFMSR